MAFIFATAFYFMEYINKLADQVEINIISGLRGARNNLTLPKEVIEESIIQERLNLLSNYFLKGINRIKDLYVSINCVPIDCQPISKCSCGKQLCSDPEIAHFEIPLIYFDPGLTSIQYIGTSDKMNPFSFYTNPMSLNNSRYKKRGKNKPTVYIDTTPNKNGFLDGYIFNAPLLENISIVAVFKDPRQLTKFNCCEYNRGGMTTDIDAEIVDNVTKKLSNWYKIGALPNLPNNQEYALG